MKVQLDVYHPEKRVIRQKCGSHSGGERLYFRGRETLSEKVRFHGSPTPVKVDDNGGGVLCTDTSNQQ